MSITRVPHSTPFSRVHATSTKGSHTQKKKTTRSLIEPVLFHVDWSCDASLSSKFVSIRSYFVGIESEGDGGGGTSAHRNGQIAELGCWDD